MASKQTLVTAVVELDRITAEIAEARESAGNTPERRMVKALHKVQNLVPEVESADLSTLTDAIGAAMANLPTGSDVDRNAGSDVANKVRAALDAIGAGIIDSPTETFEADATAALGRYNAVAKRTRGKGDSTPDAPGRARLTFSYPDGSESVEQVGGNLAFGTHVEQAVRNSSLRWEITRRAKAFSGIEESARGAYRWPEAAAADWKAWWAKVKGGNAATVTLTLDTAAGPLTVDVEYLPTA